MEDSIFTKIIRGDIPGEFVYRDDRCVVLMTIDPITPGHCMVIPREQIDSVWDMPDDLYHHLMTVAKMIAKAMERAYDYPRIGQAIEGFGVPHAHIHVLGLTSGFDTLIPEHVARRRMVTPEEQKLEADKIREQLVD